MQGLYCAGMTDLRARLQFRAKLFRGLGDPSRLAILDALRRGSMTVGEIQGATGLTQSNASTHLRCLSDCGLVVGEPDGRFMHYRLADRKIDNMFDMADALLADNAARVLACVNYAMPIRSNVRPARRPRGEAQNRRRATRQ